MNIKFLTIIILTISPIICYSQVPLMELDTSIDYQEQFYFNGKLQLDSFYVFKDTNTNTYYDLDHFTYPGTIDTTKMLKVRHGKWIFYFDKRKQESSKSQHEYYTLTEYSAGYSRNGYIFRKDGSLYESFIKHPKIGDSIFNGIREISYDKKGRIKKVEYDLFKENKDNRGYINVTYYRKDGTMKEYILIDDYLDKHFSKKFNRKEEIIYDYVWDTETFKISKWSSNLRKKKVTEYLNGKKLIRFFKDGNIIKEKEQ